MLAAFLEGLFYLVFFGTFGVIATISRKRKKQENVMRHQKIVNQKRTVDFALQNGSFDN